MTPENQEKLMKAYEAALGTETMPGEIAGLLRDVILGEMEGKKPDITYSGGGITVGDGIGVTPPVWSTTVPTYGNLNKVTCVDTDTSEKVTDV